MHVFLNIVQLTFFFFDRQHCAANFTQNYEEGSTRLLEFVSAALVMQWLLFTELRSVQMIITR